MSVIKAAAEWILLATALLGAVLAWAKVVRPALRERAAERAQRAAINEVLVGRDEIPANPITGEPAKPGRPAIGQQVADLAKVVDQLATKIDEVHHEVHHNDGSSLKDSNARLEVGVGEIRDRLRDGDRRFDAQADRLARIESVLADELAVATDTIAHAAEASSTVIKVIDLALQANPPAELQAPPVDAAADPPPDLD